MFLSQGTRGPDSKVGFLQHPLLAMWALASLLPGLSRPLCSPSPRLPWLGRHLSCLESVPTPPPSQTSLSQPSHYLLRFPQTLSSVLLFSYCESCLSLNSTVLTTQKSWRYPAISPELQAQICTCPLNIWIHKPQAGS